MLSRFKLYGRDKLLNMSDQTLKRSRDIETLRPITRIGDGDIRSVRLLGCDQPLTWNQDNDGLHIDLPDEKPNDQAYAFKIEIDGEIDLEM